MKKIGLLIFMTVALAGCRTIHLSEMSPTGRLANLLPAVEQEIDVRSLESAFGATVTKGSSFEIMETFTIDNYTTYANPVIQDLITLYERDMRNIFDEYGDRKGSVMCRLVVGDGGDGGFGWMFLSAFTLGIPNLFGMPIMNGKAEMMLEMVVFDKSDRIVGRYTSNLHKTRVPKALYHGYSNPVKKAAIDTFKRCMNDIKREIERDFSRLNTALTGEL